MGGVVAALLLNTLCGSQNPITCILGGIHLTGLGTP
jgi:hypothetical protein